MNLVFQKKAQELLEALYIDPDTNKLDFNYKGKDGLSVKMGKGKGVQFEPYISNSKDFGGSKVVTLFSTSHIKGAAREQIVTPILKALKGQSTAEIDKDEFRKWLKRAAFVMGKYIRDQVKPDAVLAVKSSSNLNNMFMKELASNLPGVVIIPDAIGKADISKITISPKADEKQTKQLERELKKAKQAGVLSFKKIHVSLRGHLKGVMELDKLAQNIEGKTIVVLDDIMTTRATQIHAIDVIRQYNPKEIVGVTLFKA
jgi:uracil phosphoribosyltransferase